jgi:VanZ family protein
LLGGGQAVLNNAKTSAWPLAFLYTVLIVYASLHPFSGWRVQGLSPFAFLAAPWPRYWTWFDVISNILGYAPLGFLLAVGGVRQGFRGAVVGAIVLASLLSLCMEATQSFLPVRVPSQLDWCLNTLGAAMGAFLVWILRKVGGLERWSQFRRQWFVEDARGALVLLAIWPVGLLFPLEVPLGLGQVVARASDALAAWEVPQEVLAWLPERLAEGAVMAPLTEVVSVALGGLVPVLMLYAVLRSKVRRPLGLCLVLLAGLSVTALSQTLSFGPARAWAWWHAPVAWGVGVAAGLGVLALVLPERACAVMALLALAVNLTLLNPAPTSAYLAHNLQTWEQGQFIRFNGLAEWIGWLWPFVTLFYLAVRVSKRN